MKKIKEYFNQVVEYPMWAVWVANIYIGLLALKWLLNGLIFILELFV